MPTGTTSEISTFKGQGRRLRADRIGVAGLLLSVVAASAPLMVTAGVMPTTYGTMGIVGQPLLFVILGAVLTLFSLGYAEMSRHVHNAGAFYAYIARGLGGTAGAAASVVALVAYSAMQFAIYGIFGFELSGLLDEHLGVRLGWWVPALAAVAVVGALGWLKIDLNAKVLGVLLLVECAMVVAFDVAAVGSPGPDGVSLHSFDPQTLTGAGLGTALSFTIASFVGFEQAAVYAEETSRPQVAVARVTFLAVGFVALFFALASWALSVAAGPSRITGLAGDEGPNLLFALSEDRFGAAFTDVMHLFYVTGMFAAMLSFHNVVARYAFAMGREGLLPAALGRTSRASGAPAYGSLLQSAVSLLAVAVFAVTDDGPHGDPTAPVQRLFTWMGNVGALGVILLMATASAAVIVFFVRRGAARAQAPRLVAAGAAGLILLVIVGYAVKDFDVLLGADPGSALRWILPGIVGAAVVLGLGYGLALKAVRPEVHARIGLGNEAFRLEEAAQAAAGTAGGPARPHGPTTQGKVSS
ncbi:APC family permease [Streptomyces cinnamoneus]|uniref:Amino acid permease n=1 Tax=Streptomyces cinnamoneus TaxID=53446 RepID=A0A918TH74_STRCJ|nr:APC family permease [Streptomyces cinnamoneus]GHC41571.1 amino acid permease [Streptomyces cinnamoneus]